MKIVDCLDPEPCTKLRRIAHVGILYLEARQNLQCPHIQDRLSSTGSPSHLQVLYGVLRLFATFGLLPCDGNGFVD